MSQIVAWPTGDDSAAGRRTGMVFLGRRLRFHISQLTAADCAAPNTPQHRAVFEKAVMDLIGDGGFTVRFVDPSGTEGDMQIVTVGGTQFLGYDSGGGVRKVFLQFVADEPNGSGNQFMKLGGSSVCTFTADELGTGQSYLTRLCAELGLDGTNQDNLDLALACVNFRRCR